MRVRKQLKLRKQQGNATVETILIATVAVPLLTGIPLIGKIADINNTTTQSSRYLAWEQTIAGPNYKSSDQLEIEVRNRFFARPDLQIRTDQDRLTDEESENPLWTGYGYQEDDEANRLVSLDSSVTQSVTNVRPNSIAGTLSSGIKTIGDTMAGFTGGEWDIEENGLYTGMVTIEVASNPIMSSGFDCDDQESESAIVCVRRSNTIYADGWDAENAAHAANRSRTFVPAGALEPVGNTLADIATLVPFFADIQGLRSDNNGGFGYVNPNVLPMDRYAED
ncbi:MAG: hypothetical protein KME65_13740 [Candidatus Thiodiazotropha sp. (ex Ctena orbiculata)]|uniref:Uncharacterized protein n=1 Tax=Candidatus Thiodiazotropha taylori TaxID=2792791 RepID=A0A944M8N9_9GAMM|nr:hypothetical protein [Candidatus Thiodiazotropha taylori]MBV2137002.1 hypothetical protein [Candidatus Thiodiazotropha taylori]PUB84771.1 MAG: hypothetical protein DBP00_14360 [gamma proteobacterium symbiont of Ctena orbiculata]